MLSGLLKRIIGDHSEKAVAGHRKTAAVINGLEPQMQSLSDADLSQKTVEFRRRLADGESLNSMLPEAFAVVREASRRTLGMRHFDVQLIGGMVLHDGNVAEMKTGEGKTLVATLPLYLNALKGKGAHLITVNDYLARRDADWMGQIYRYLGLNVGLIVHGLESHRRRAAYMSDITYGTNNEFGFDYLRDNMAISINDIVQGPLHFAIVDEADSILIDEARTPLIISGPAEKPTELYFTFAKLVQRLHPETDYTVEEKERRVSPTEEGIARVEKWLNITNITGEHSEMYHYLLNALKAKELFHRDHQYVVKDGQVIIVDDFTGRLMFGRRWSDGLHQAVEAKEGVKIERESVTMATITIQNYFRMYEKLSGMTGTAKTEEGEFQEIYRMDVIVIPTNRPLARQDHPDIVYKTAAAKFKWIIEEIVERHQTGQPILVGTISIEKSELLSELLKRRGVTHQVLNAKFHEKEAEIVAQAGRLGAVTIATNMAGRGTDILLGGNPEFMAKQMMQQKGHEPEEIRRAAEGLPSGDADIRRLQEVFQGYYREFKQQCDAEAEQVRAAGGLHIIGTERHEARRIDHQLRGRAGRQGDPGSTRFYVGLDDDLMRLFGGETVSNIMDRLGLDDDTPIDAAMITKAIENAQKKVEARNFDIRKHVLQYDQVLNEQRDLIYTQRRKVLIGGDGVREAAVDAITNVCGDLAAAVVPEDVHLEDWDPKELSQAAEAAFLVPGALAGTDFTVQHKPEAKEKLAAAALEFYAAKEERLGSELMRELERVVFLRTVDEKWIDHLTSMDDLRDGIGLRAYGQRDPLVEYKFEAYDMFNSMIEALREDVVRSLFRLEVRREASGQSPGADAAQSGPRPAGDIPPELQLKRRQMTTSGPKERPGQPVRAEKTAGRNEPCPCGSGKKYKRCCGRSA